MPWSHLAVGVGIEQGRLHADRGLGGVKDHVVHILLHHIRISDVLHQTNSLLTWLQLSEMRFLISSSTRLCWSRIVRIL